MLLENIMKRFCLSAISIAIVINWNGAALSQPLWNGSIRNSTLDIELIKPEFTSNPGFEMSSISTFITARRALNRHLVALVELPYVHNKFMPFESGERTDDIGGNPYIGLESWDASDVLFSEIGIRIPIYDEVYKGSLAGISSDLERLSAFQSDYLTIKFNLNYYLFYSEYGYFRFRAGPSIWKKVRESIHGDQTELFFHTAAMVRDELNDLILGTGIATVLYISTDRPSGQNIDYQSVSTIGYRIGRFLPSVRIILPLDEYLKDISDYSISFCTRIEF